MDDARYKELTVSEFTKAAEVYDTGHAGIYEMCKDDYPPILRELSSLEFEDLLDVGCGTGPMIELLASELPDKNYTGLDLTPRMIEVANEKGIAGARFVVGDAEDLPFDDGSFDVVICANSFHHYPQPRRFFDEVARVLRPGGRLVLRDYTSAAPVVWLMNHVEMPLANLMGHGDVRAYTLDQVRAFCATAGLVPLTLEARKKFRMHLVARKPEDAEGDPAAEPTTATVADPAAEFKWGTDSGEEFVALEPRVQLVSGQSYNVQMRKHTLRGRLFAAIVGKNLNNRLALLCW